ncbi:hypothetical protein ACLOJK_026741 [Asimina triloba]
MDEGRGIMGVMDDKAGASDRTAGSWLAHVMGGDAGELVGARIVRALASDGDGSAGWGGRIWLEGASDGLLWSEMELKTAEDGAGGVAGLFAPAAGVGGAAVVQVGRSVQMG